jgi:hypothetical protein
VLSQVSFMFFAGPLKDLKRLAKLPSLLIAGVVTDSDIA